MNLRPPDPDPSSLFRLDGRVALITGATGLLGRPMAEALARAGAHVVVNARRADAVMAVVEELKRRGWQASAASFDITDEGAVREHLAKVQAEQGRLDILVNNASAGRPGTMESTTLRDFDEFYKVNVAAAFDLMQNALPLLKEAARANFGGASVINIASMYGSVSPDPSIYGSSGANNPPSYGAAKAALIQLTRYAAVHLAPYKVRVNCISPGPFPAGKYLEKDRGFGERLSSRVPLGRTGEPSELRGPLLFLASDASSFVTGANLPVDGGWTAW